MTKLLKLVEKRQETPTIYSFIFKPEGNIQFTAGQFIDITVTHENPDHRGIRRHFSISSSPTENFLMIATRIIENGSTFKKALFALPLGSLIEVGEPHGHFILAEKAAECLFITGGVGITPVRSIIKYATDKQLPNRLVLLFSNTTAEEIPFKNFFDELITPAKGPLRREASEARQGRHNPKLEVVHTITKPKESKTDWSGRVGRIDEGLIRENVRDVANTIFFISGPVTLVSAFTELLTNLNVPQENIKRENFPGY